MNPTWLYVAVLYALAVWLARRGGVDLPRRIAALFYLLTLLFLLRPMTGAFVNVATDVTQLIPPWSASAPGLTKYQVSNMETQDVPMFLVPWAHQVRESWRAGRLPLWNDLAGCGYPLMANAQAAALSPLRLLALPLPLKLAITAEGAMKILMALTFTFLYCRRRGYSELPSAVAAIAFGFGPFIVVWLNFPMSTVAALLPAVLYAIDLLAEKRTPARLAFAAAMGPLVVFGGHPETALHMAAFAAAYAIWIAIVERPPGTARFIGALCAAGIVAVLLALPMLAAMGKAIPDSIRYARAAAWSREVPFSDFHSLALIAQPRLGPPHAEAVTGFSGILAVGAWFGVGFDALRRRVRARELFLLLAALFVFLVLANVSVPRDMADLVFRLTTTMRLRFLLAWITAVLTAALLDRAMRGDVGALGVAILSSVVTLLYIVHRMHPAVALMIPSIIVLAMAVLLFVPMARRVAPIILAVAIVAEIWAVTIGWNPARPASTLYPRTPLIDAVLRARGAQPYRALGLGAVLYPNTNAIFGIEDVRVIDPMAPARYVAMLQREVPGYDLNEYYPKWNDPDTPLLDALNVRWVMTEPGRTLPDRFPLRYDGPDGRLYENPRVLPRFYSKEARVTIAAWSPTDYTLIVDAPRETLIESSVGYSSDWRVAGGRAEARPLFVSFMAPAGHTVIRVRYVPIWFYASLAISLLTAFALAAYIIRRRV